MIARVGGIVNDFKNYLIFLYLYALRCVSQPSIIIFLAIGARGKAIKIPHILTKLSRRDYECGTAKALEIVKCLIARAIKGVDIALDADRDRTIEINSVEHINALIGQANLYRLAVGAVHRILNAALNLPFEERGKLLGNIGTTEKGKDSVNLR